MRTIADDLLHTVRAQRKRTYGRRRPFAICICWEKREALKAELAGLLQTRDPTYQPTPIYMSVHVYGAQIGSILPAP